MASRPPPALPSVANSFRLRHGHRRSSELDVPVVPRGDELPARAAEERADDRQHDRDRHQIKKIDDRKAGDAWPRSRGCDRCTAAVPAPARSAARQRGCRPPAGRSGASSSCRPTKYHGALAGSGVRLGLAMPSAERRRRRRGRARSRPRRAPTTTWRTSRCGQVNTVSSVEALLGGDRLSVDDTEHADCVRRSRLVGGVRGTEATRRCRPGPRSLPRRTPPRRRALTAKPSLRTRQMCTISSSTRATGSTATWSA